LGLYFLFRKSNLRQLQQVKDHLNYGLLFIVLLINLINLILMILRWYFLVKPVKATVSLKNIYIISLNAIAANFAVPGKMGVPAKAILLKNTENIDYSHVTPSLANELFLEYFTILIFFVTSAIAGGFLDWQSATSAISWRIVFLFLFLLGFAGGGWFFFRKTKRIGAFLKNFSHAYKLSAKRKDLFLVALLITVVNLFLTFYADKLLFKSMGFTIPYIFVIFSSSFSSIAALISPLPGGIGIREIANGYFYKIFYNLGEVAVAAIIIRRLITYFSLILLFVLERLFSSHFSIEIRKEIS